MKITSCNPYQYKDGIPQRVMITLVAEVKIWLKGKTVTRKRSFTRHLRLIRNSEEYMGLGIHKHDLVVYGEYEAITGTFALDESRSKSIMAKGPKAA